MHKGADYTCLVVVPLFPFQGGSQRVFAVPKFLSEDRILQCAMEQTTFPRADRAEDVETGVSTAPGNCRLPDFEDFPSNGV